MLARGAMPMPGQTVTVIAKPVGSTTAKPAGTAVSDAAGKWKLTVKPKLRTTYTAALAGIASPPPVVIEVAHKLTLTVLGTTARRTFTGTLAPKHARRTVTLQRRIGTRWVRYATVKTTSRSTFRITKRLAKGRHRFRATTAKDTQHLAGTSTTRRVTVR